MIAAGIIPGGMEMMDRPAIHAAEDFVACRLSARCRGAADRRARRAAGRSRSSGRAGRGDRRRQPRGARSASSQQRGGAAAVLGRPQGGVPGGRPHLARLLLHGRHHPAPPPARGAGAHDATLSEQLRAGRRQRVPRRRRQSAPADPLRCQQAGRARAGRGVRRRHPAALRRGRRRADRRARGRRREARPDGKMFTETDLDQQSASNAPSTPKACSTPARCSRQLHRCAELGRMHVHRGELAFPDLPRF